MLEVTQRTAPKRGPLCWEDQPESMNIAPPNAKAWFVFGTWCVLGATQWLLPDASLLPAREGGARALGVLLATLLSWTVAVQQRGSSRASLIRSGFAGALLFTGLHWPAWIGAQGVTGGDMAISFAATPVVIAVAEQALGREGHADLTGRLWPGLGALAGLLLILPEPAVRNVGVLTALVGAPLFAGIGAVLVSNFAADLACVRAAVLTGALASAVAGLLLQKTGSPFALPSPAKALLLRAGWEGMSVLLGFHALLQLRAFRWSAAFAVVPLLVVLEGGVLAASWPAGRILAGMALLLFAAVFLLLPSTRAEETPSLF